jgi:DNA repair protein RadC
VDTENRQEMVEHGLAKSAYSKTGVHPPISQWPLSERPRERLFAQGAAALSDAELLALFLRTGVRGQSAVALASASIASAGGLQQLLSMPPARLRKLHGLGPARAASLSAVAELGSRCLAASLKQKLTLTDPEKVFSFLRQKIGSSPVECFVALFLDQQHGLIDYRELFRGTVSQTAVYPREVVKTALELNACALIVAHNHPSGTAEPSAADHHLTQALKSALAVVDIRVLDHIVVTATGCYSFARAGVL